MDSTAIVLLNEHKIRENLNTSPLIDIVETIESTNDYLKNDRDPNHQIKICLAETQTKGRGRLDRQWHSPFGQNIYFSLKYFFQKEASALSGLSLVVGLATCHTIQTITDKIIFKVKWPNDIMADQQKIAGVLIEITSESNDLCEVIIGIGINVNMQETQKIDQPWTSLQKVTGQTIDRNLLCSILINTLMDYLARFSKQGLSTFMQDWAEKDYLFEKPVSLISGQHQVNGIGAGISEQGYLNLLLPDQTIRSFSSGETNLLK